MTERPLRDAMLSADLQASTTHHPTTATIYTDPPTTHHGHFLPTNPMPYMAPSATHQPELLLLHWMLCTITTLVDDLQHHPINCPGPHSPDVLVYQHTSLQTLSTTPQHHTSLDQHDPRSPTRAPHSSIRAWFPRLAWTLSHGPHCYSHARSNQLPLRHAYIDRHCHATTNRHNSSSSTPP